jgi:hypothetical protein
VQDVVADLHVLEDLRRRQRRDPGRLRGREAGAHSTARPKTAMRRCMAIMLVM